MSALPALPWIKVCGLTRPEDARLALDLGARYLGCILVPTSPRVVSRDQARVLREIAGSRLVVVVRDLLGNDLAEIVRVVEPGVLQLHGAEPPEQVAALREAHPEVEIWRVLSVPPAAEQPPECAAALVAEARRYLEAGAAAIVLDTITARGSGGTGQTCDWSVAAALVERLAGPVVLAGGITPENVTRAAAQVCPAGMDVGSGVEASPGIKSAERLRRLFEALPQGRTPSA